MWMIKRKKGQSTVEYILLVTAVIAVMVIFATNNNSGSLRATLNSTYSQSANEIGIMGGKLFGNKHDSGPASTSAVIGGGQTVPLGNI